MSDETTDRVHERAARLSALNHGPADVERLGAEVRAAVLRGSAHIREGNFNAVAPADLKLLFERYDQSFFDGLLGAMLRDDRAGLAFRLSRRMTRVAGTTTMHKERRRAPGGMVARVHYEVAISSVILFGAVNDRERPLTVGGLVCRDRLEALQRVFEHELLHLAEFLAWGRSSCSEANFHQLSRRIFGHLGVTHDLVTPREVAAKTYDVRVGDRVAFEHDSVRRVGIVNRITRRATVLVEDPAGRDYSDGKRYLTFYVPVSLLRKNDLAG